MHALIYLLTRDSEQRDLVMDRLQYAVQATMRDEQLGGGVGEDCLLREPGQHCTLGRLLKQPGLGPSSGRSSSRPSLPSTLSGARAASSLLLYLKITR